MGIFTGRPALRWAVPSAAALALVGGTLAAGGLTAQADSGLAPRTAHQLLTNLASAQPTGLAGTVAERADLGLPDLSAITGDMGGHGGSAGDASASSLLSWASGSHTLRVWDGGPTRSRIAVLDSLGESDIVRNGKDVWTWSSADQTAKHIVLSNHQAAQSAGSGTDVVTGAPTTPAAAAKHLLAAIDPTTVVRTSGTDTVAGRAAYDLVLEPRDQTSLIGQVRLAIDATEHVPLQVQVFAKGATEAAIDVGFTSVSFGPQKASTFEFTPPPGATVTTPKTPSKADWAQGKAAAEHAKSATSAVGKGWTTVVVTKLPAESGSASQAGPGAGAQLTTQLLSSLPKVSGAWGQGRLLHSSLFNVVITTDGRVAVGAVTPDALYAALATR